MHLLDPVEARDADDDVREALAPGLAHPHRAHLGHAGDATHDPLHQAGQARRRPVHERVDVAAAQPHGGDQHDGRDEDRGDRVAAGNARRGQADADEHGHGAGEVRSEVPRVGDERGVSLLPARAQRHRRAGRVDDEHEKENDEHVRAGVDRRAARLQAQDGLDRDPDRRPREEDRLAERRQMLRLAMAVGVLAIGRALGHADGVQGQDGGHGIDAGVGRLRQDAEAAAGEPDHQLDHHQDDRGRQGDQRRAPRDRHARESIAPQFPFFIRKCNDSRGHGRK